MLTGCLGISRNARSIENKFTWARSCLLGKLPDRDHRSFLGDPVVGQIENLGSSVEGLHLRSIQGFWGLCRFAGSCKVWQDLEIDKTQKQALL